MQFSKACGEGNVLKGKGRSLDQLWLSVKPQFSIEFVDFIILDLQLILSL